MTAVGLIVTGLVLALLAVREVVRVGAGGVTPFGWRRLDRAILPAVAAWAVLTAVQLADYLR
jgi:hypothetical protein